MILYLQKSPKRVGVFKGHTSAVVLVNNVLEVFAPVLEDRKQNGVVLGLRRRRVDVEGRCNDGCGQDEADHTKGYGGRALGASPGTTAKAATTARGRLILH